MTDFEERLSGVLTAEADDAPQVAGLAQAARRRHGARRRKQLAVGGAAVVLAIVGPFAVISSLGRDGSRVAGDPMPTGGWRTIEEDGVVVDVPSNWAENPCEREIGGIVYGPSGGDDCSAFLNLYEAEDSEDPGVVRRFVGDEGKFWAGYVEAGDWGAAAWTDDRDLTLRILASMRLEGQPQVVADLWEQREVDGISYRAPVGWGVDAEVDDGYQVLVEDEVSKERRLRSSEQVDAAHYRLQGQLPESIVTITAPTLAVAQLVWASVEHATSSSPDPADALLCDPGMGDPQPGPNCPDVGYSTGTMSLDEDGRIVFDGVGGSPSFLDLGAVQVCSGVIEVDYREPLADHVVDCSEFRRALEGGTPPIPVVVWEDGADVLQVSELYHP